VCRYDIYAYIFLPEKNREGKQPGACVRAACIRDVGKYVGRTTERGVMFLSLALGETSDM